MHRDTTLTILRTHKSNLMAEHHVKSLALYGSVARNDAHAASDVDILVEFDRPVGIFEFVRLQSTLAALLGCPVDLATPEALRTSMRTLIEEESIYA